MKFGRAAAAVKRLTPGQRVTVSVNWDGVCWLFIFKDTEPSPLQDSFSGRSRSQERV